MRALTLIPFLVLAMSTTAAPQTLPHWVEPVVTITDTVWPEGDGETDGYITVTLSFALAIDLRINEIAVTPYWSDPRDYPYASISFESGVHVIPAGDTEIRIPVHIKGNDSYQSKPKEWSTCAEWHGGSGLEAVDGCTWFQFILSEDDPIPLVTVPEDLRIPEDSGPHWLTLTGSSPVTGTFTLSVNGETATPRDDFDPLEYPFVWEFFNEPSISIPIRIVADYVVEPDETFVYELLYPRNLQLSRTSVRITIVNDDVADPSVSLTNTQWPEGDGQHEGHLTLTLSHAYPRNINISPQLEAPPPDAKDRGWVEVQLAPGPHVIPAGETEFSLRFFITGNDSHQSAPKIWPGHMALWDGAVFHEDIDFDITLIEDDPIATVSIADVTVVEGHGGQTPATLTLTAPAPVTGWVSMRLIDDTASAFSDYDPAFCCPNPIAFNDQLQVSIPFFVWGDVVAEEDETFLVEFFDPFDLQLERTRARVTIVDDDKIDASAEFSPRELSLYSGEAALLAVRLSPPNAEDRMLTLSTANALIHIPPSVIIAPSATATLEVTAMTPGLDQLQCAGHHIRCDGVPITVLAPMIERIWPARGSIAGGTEVTIYGDGLSSGCSVSFGDVAAMRTTFVTRQMLIATTSPHEVGDADIHIHCGSVDLVLDNAFRFEASPPPLGRRRSARH